MTLRYITVDVFTDRPFAGNPLAVVTDARGLTTGQMQAIAAEFNDSESTFVLPPDEPAHTARVRIFTRTSEIPFAGHPNVGTDARVGWLAVRGRGGHDGRAVTREAERRGVHRRGGAFPHETGTFSLHVYARTSGARGEPDLRARMFSPLGDTFEDPATGSANGALGGLLASLVPERDTVLRLEILQERRWGARVCWRSPRKSRMASSPACASAADACQRWKGRSPFSVEGTREMKFGIHIGHMGGPIDEMRKLWKFADAKGFDWFSVSDHFQESPPRGGDMDCYEAIATLTAAAMDTKHVRLGSGVYCVVYRNPALLAKSLTTIDHLSNGRVDCGLGAGWHEIEAKAYGYPFPSIGPREDMLEEYAQILRLLLDPEQRRANFQGKHFSVTNAPNNPKPLQPRIPIWIGGRGEKRTLRAAAKYADGWNAAYIGPEDWKHKSDVLTSWCEKEGRDSKTIMRTVNLGFYLGADAKGAARAEQVFQSHWGGQGGERAQRTGYLRGTVKDARAMVDEFRTLECTRLNIAFREGPYDWESLEAFAAEIVRKG